jgi:hypothetical protein
MDVTRLASFLLFLLGLTSSVVSGAGCSEMSDGAMPAVIEDLVL